jgi:hypothetical protein
MTPMSGPRPPRVDINDLLSRFLHHHQIAHPLLSFLIHNDRQNRGEKEQDDIRDSQPPGTLDEIAIVRIVPQTPIARTLADSRSGRRDIYHIVRIDGYRVALVVCDGGGGRDTRYQCPHQYQVTESDPESRISCANRGDEDYESPNACEKGDDEETQDPTGNGNVVLIVPTGRRAVSMVV